MSLPCTAGRMHLLRVTSVVILTLLFLLALPVEARADEVRYSLGTVQEDSELRVTSGGTVITTVGFYNIDGNVPTMVEVSVSKAPADWIVTLEQPGKASDVSDAASLLVQPSVPQASSPECPGENREVVWLPPRGYVSADVLRVRIEVPGSTRDGTRGTVYVTAVAQWQAEGTVAPFPQERGFVFDVMVSTEPTPQASADLSPDSARRTSLLLAGGICAGVLLLAARRVLAKSGDLA